MGVQKKNLLEAFRNAGEASQPAESAGPFAKDASRSAARRQRGMSFDGARTLGVPALPAWLPWAAGVAFAFVLGLALGRASLQSAVAAEETEDAQETGAKGRTTAALPFVPATEVIQADAEPAERAVPAKSVTSALFDTANKYTVVVATYGTSRADFAWATHDQLRDASLAAFPPIERGGNIVVVVGAAATSKELGAALEQLRGLTGWDGSRNAYADAYVEQIDRLLDR